MKQKSLLRSMLLLCALIVGSSSVWAAEVVYKTALFGSSYNSTSVGNYTSTWTATYNSFTVSLANFNNNNNGWNYVKCGRKDNDSEATITTSAAIDNPITKVVVTIDAITASNVNSIMLYTKTTSSNTWVVAGTYTKAKGAQSVTLSSPTENLLYKLVFDCASGSSNGLVQVSKVEYYYDEPNAVAAPTFLPAAGAVPYGTDITVSAATDCYLNYTTDGTDPAVSQTAIMTEGNTATVNITAATTIRAIAIDGDLNESAEASAQYTIAAPTKPTFSPSAGAVPYGTKVSISANVGTILYTTDGSTPSFGDEVNGEEYTNPIEITKGTMIKAIAIDNGGNVSNVTTGIYTISYPNADSNAFDFALSNDYGSGVSQTSSENDSHYETSEATWTSGNVTLKTNGKYRWWSADGTLRIYNNDNSQSTLTLTVPSGYVITKIEFTGGQSFLSNVGTYSSGIWFGDAQSVIFTYNSNKSVNVKTITITYSQPVTITPAKAVTTYVTTDKLDFDDVDGGLEAFVATAAANGVVTLAKVGAVPAGTPLLLRGTASTDYTVPVVASATAPTTNLLRAGDGETTIGGDGVYDYILSNGLWYHANAGTVAVGKAYLHCESDPTTTTGDAPSLSMDWGEGTTGIVNLNRETINDNQYYTLDGRRVAEPTKGLYILNGRKVVVK